MALRISIVLLSALVLIAGWLLVAPSSAGGPVTYLVTSGRSMEPTIQSGALVLLRESDEYQVGDIAAFESPQRGLILHRIVEDRGSSFLMQGDNNASPDPITPGYEEMAGKLWVHIPALGGWLDAMFQPRVVFVALFFLAGIVFLFSPRFDVNHEDQRRMVNEPIDDETLFSERAVRRPGRAPELKRIHLRNPPDAD